VVHKLLTPASPLCGWLRGCMDYKQWYKSKIIVFNLLTALAAVLALPELLAILPEGGTQFIILAQAFITIVLRVFSHTIIGVVDKE
jgi:hypothetical protein